MNFSSVEDFIQGFLETYYEPLDPNNLLCMAWKWQHGDVSRNTNGNLHLALKRIKAKTYVIAFDGDMFVPAHTLRYEQNMVTGSEFHTVKTICGHFALFSLEPEYMTQIDGILNKLLSESV